MTHAPAGVKWNFKSEISVHICNLLLNGRRNANANAHGFIQTIVVIISLEKLKIFQRKLVIYMSTNTICSTKTCALISNTLIYSAEVSTLSPAINVQCQSNMVSIKRLLHT